MSKPAATKADQVFAYNPRAEWRDTVTGEVVEPGTEGAEPTGRFVVSIGKEKSPQMPLTVEVPDELVERKTIVEWRKDARDSATLKALIKGAAEKWTERDRERARLAKREQKRKRSSRAKPKEQRARRGGGRQRQKFPGIKETFRDTADAVAEMLAGNGYWVSTLDDLDLHDMAAEFIGETCGWKQWERIVKDYGLDSKDLRTIGAKPPYLELMAECVFQGVRSRRWDDVSWFTWDRFVDAVREAIEREGRDERYGIGWYPPAYWAFDLGQLGEAELAKIYQEGADDDFGNDLNAIRYGMESYVVYRLGNDLGEVEQALQRGDIPAEIVPLAERRIAAVQRILDRWPEHHLPDSICFYSEDSWPQCRALPLEEFAAAMARDCERFEQCITPVQFEPEPEGFEEPAPAREPTEEDWREAERLFSNPEPRNISKRGAALLKRVYEEERAKGRSKKRASMAAWGALKSAGYVKRGGRWVKPRTRKNPPKQGGSAKRARRTPPAPNPAPSAKKLKEDGAVLGGMVELEVQTPEGVKLYTWRRPYPVLWWSPEARALAVVDGGKVSRPRKPSTKPAAKAVRVREEFQGAGGDRVRDVELPAGKLHREGQAVRIIYESNKHNGGGDGQRRLFEHKFAASDVAWTQRKKGPALLAVTGPRLTVTDRGIVY